MVTLVPTFTPSPHKPLTNTSHPQTPTPPNQTLKPNHITHKHTSPTMASTAKTVIKTLRQYIKKPWEITGPCSSPEYKSAVPLATEYRPFCPATEPAKAIIPTSDPGNVFDIKYFNRDQRRNRPPIRRTILKKEDVVKQVKECKFDVSDFPPVYLTKAVEEDYNARGGGYCK